MVITMGGASGQASLFFSSAPSRAQGRTLQSGRGATLVALRQITAQCLSSRLYRAEVQRGQERQADALEEEVTGHVWWLWHVSSLLALHLCVHESSFQTGPASSTSSSASSPATGHLNWCECWGILLGCEGVSRGMSSAEMKGRIHVPTSAVENGPGAGSVWKVFRPWKQLGLG